MTLERLGAMARSRTAGVLRRAGRGLIRTADALETAPERPPRDAVRGAREPADRFAAGLFAGAAAVYLVSRLVALEDFPIYFFCDEAIQAVRASDLLRRGLRDQFGQFLPTYFKNGPFFNLSTSVYARVPAVALFGHSVFVTRAVSALFSLSAAVAVSAILKRTFQARFWWTGALLLGITPAWFLHSRTAFETTLAASMYAWFLYFYLEYRNGRPKALFAAVLFGAFAFYSYSPMQIVVPATALVFLISDARYHAANRRTALAAVGLAAVLALPYARHAFTHPDSPRRHLEHLFSYWVDPKLTAPQKLERYGREYAMGLSPSYWFDPNHDRDLVRHRMKGYGNFLLATVPFLAVGLLVCLRKIRSSSCRAVLLSLLLAPAGAAVAGTGITRVLVFAVPAAVLTGLGLSTAAAALSRRIPQHAIALALFVALAGGQIFMLADAVRNGPTCFRDYGLGGMQYGASQVFGEVERQLGADPRLHVRISPDWANGTSDVGRFFLGESRRYEFQGLQWWLAERRVTKPSDAAVLTEDEFRQASSDRLLVVTAQKTLIPYPDGRPGFRFVRLGYAPDADALFAAERLERLRPVAGEIVLRGERIAVSHSRPDMGQLRDVFDENPASLMRTAHANPAVFELEFPREREVASVAVTTGTMDVRLTVTILRNDGSTPAVRREIYRKLPADPTVRMTWQPAAAGVRRLRIEVANDAAPDDDHVHIREIRIEPSR